MGKLVISHDMPLGNEQGLEDFLAFAGKFASVKSPLTLALNIKADGMADVLSEQLSGYPQLNCFVFDMSVPDMRSYLKAGIPVFTRMSEIELAPAFLSSAVGVWLDAFENEWYDTKVIEDLISAGKKVCIVSPELHGRPHMEAWRILRALGVTDRVILCTDKPEDALVYFKELERDD